MSEQRIYETVYVLNPEMTDEEVEANVQNTVSLLETHGASIIRTERGGKRRLAYPIEKQRYGYYNLIHYHGANAALSELERMFRLSDRVLRYLTVRFDKEDHLTSLTRMGDDDGRDDDRDDRRRGDRGRRGDRDFGRGPRRFDNRDRDRDRGPMRGERAEASADVDDDDTPDDDEMESPEELD
jgi:small subunit ribosomal protein S6